MNTKTIAELIKLMDSANLKVLDVSEGETKIRLEKNNSSEVTYIPKPEIITPKLESKSEVIDFNNLSEVRSPLVGVFYAAPSPNNPPFVKIGQKIKKGDVLCIIEAMKQMNEITAEVEGEIADVCIKNGDIVEFNQVLFKIH